MKTELVLLFALVIMLANNQVFSQPWKTNGNNTNYYDFIGTNNNNDLNIKTNNVLQMKIKKDGDVNIFNNLNVSKKITSDSLNVNSIEIGKSIWIGVNQFASNNIYTDGTGSPPYDLFIQNGVIYNTIFGASLYPNSVGINNEYPFSFNSNLYGVDVNGDINIIKSNC